MADKIEFDVLVNGKPAIDELNKVKKAQDDLESNTKKTTDNMGTNWVNLGAKVYVAVQSLQATYEATGRQIKAEQALSTALKNSKSVQDKSIENWKEYASAMQSASTFSDESIAPLVAIGAQMGMTDETIKSTIEASMDLAAATGTDLTQAFKNLGKTLTGQAEEEIVSMATGLKSLTAEELMAGDGIALVAEQYRGASAELASTSFGAAEQQLNSLGNTVEELGSFLLDLAKDTGAIFLFRKAIEATSLTIASISYSTIKAKNAIKEFFGFKVENNDVDKALNNMKASYEKLMNTDTDAPKKKTKKAISNKADPLVGFINQQQKAQAEAKAKADAEKANANAKAKAKANKDKISSFMDQLAQDISSNTSPEDAIKLKYELLRKKLQELSLLPEMTQKQKEKAESDIKESQNSETYKQEREKAKANKDKISSFMDQLAQDISSNTSPEDAIKLKYELLRKKLQELSLLPEMTQKQKEKAESDIKESQNSETYKQEREREKAIEDLNTKYIELMNDEYERESALSTQKKNNNIKDLEFLKSIDKEHDAYYESAISYETQLDKEIQKRIETAKKYNYETFNLDLTQKYIDLVEENGNNELSLLRTKKDLQYEINITNLNNLLETGKITEDQYESMKNFYDYAKDVPISTSWDNSIKDMIDTTKGFQNVALHAFGNMEDAIVNMTKTGKLNFKDLANAILDDLLRMTIRMTITANIARAMSSAFPSVFTSGTTQKAQGGTTLKAQGGIFDSSGEVRSAQGNVFTSPTSFRFAGGTGLLGEKGSEAIMPLKRTSNGDLGVQVAGGSTAPTKVQIINESNQRMEITSSSASKDNDGYILNVVINGIATNKMGIRNLIGGK